MSDLGHLPYFLGILITRNFARILLQQHRAMMKNCNPCLTPADTKSKLVADDGDKINNPTLYRSLVGLCNILRSPAWISHILFIKCTYSCIIRGCLTSTPLNEFFTTSLMVSSSIHHLWPNLWLTLMLTRLDVLPLVIHCLVSLLSWAIMSSFGRQKDNI